MEIELFFIVVGYFMKCIDSEVVLPVILYLAPLYEPFKMWFLLKRSPGEREKIAKLTKIHFQDCYFF